MLYATLLVAATAFTGFAAAQNDTSSNLPTGFAPCCTLPLNQLNSSQTGDWCTANENTCPELCGGQSLLAAQGNLCNSVSVPKADSNERILH
jgi:hypothetical protein